MISSNYYPINKFIGIKENNLNNTKSLLVFNERSQAGSSLKKGNINFVVDRFSRNSLLEKGEVFIDEEIYEKYFIHKHWLLFGNEKIDKSEHDKIEKKIDDSILIYLVEDKKQNNFGYNYEYGNLQNGIFKSKLIINKFFKFFLLF